MVYNYGVQIFRVNMSYGVQIFRVNMSYGVRIIRVYTVVQMRAGVGIKRKFILSTGRSYQRSTLYLQKRLDF